MNFKEINLKNPSDKLVQQLTDSQVYSSFDWEIPEEITDVAIEHTANIQRLNIGTSYNNPPQMQRALALLVRRVNHDDQFNNIKNEKFL